MRGVLLEVPQWLLDERAATGADRWDEVWDGVLHMTPAPSGPHQRLNLALGRLLGPACDASGLLLSTDTALHRADDDYRQPDLAVYRPEHASHRGIDHHAELVIEILSPHDESRDKLPFYAACHVTEVLLIDPGLGPDHTTTVEHHHLDHGAYHRTDRDGRAHLRTLPVTLAADGTGLHLTGSDLDHHLTIG